MSTTLDITFQGGGARGLALNGAMAELEAQDFQPGRLVGTSAGAICAALLAAGYSGADLEQLSLERLPNGRSMMTVLLQEPSGFTDQQLLDSSLGTFLQSIQLFPKWIDDKLDLKILHELLKVPLFPNIFSFVEQGGVSSADGFIDWLSAKLDAKGPGTSRFTLEQLFQKTHRHLSLVVTDTTRGTFCVLNHITAPQCPVVWAVRMSMGIPLLWPEVVWQQSWGTYGVGQKATAMTGHTMVDGGVVSNFALRLMVSNEPWIVELMGGPPDPEANLLGLSLDSDTPVPNAPPRVQLGSALKAAASQNKVFARLERLLDAAGSGNDLTEAFNYPNLICRLPVQGYGVTEFEMSTARIQALLNAARTATSAWLQARGNQTMKVKDAQTAYQTAFTAKAHSAAAGATPQP